MQLKYFAVTTLLAASILLQESSAVSLYNLAHTGTEADAYSGAYSEIDAESDAESEAEVETNDG